MRASADPKQRIKRMSRRIKDLHSRAQELERQHRTLAIQHHVMMCCCELLDWMRSSPDMHPGWMAYKEGLLPEELPLLEQLGATPLSAQGSSQPGHQQQQQPQAGQPQQQPQHQQQQVFMQAPMPAQCRTASCSSATGAGPGGTAGVLTGSAASAVHAAAASSAGSCQPQQQQQPAGKTAAAVATAEVGVPGEPYSGLSLQEVFDGAQNWELDRHPSSNSAADPSATCNNTDTSHAAAPAGVLVKLEPAAAAAVSTPASAQASARGLHAAAGTAGPAVPPSAQAQAPSIAAGDAGPGQPFDRSMLWIAAPGDFLGPMRDAFTQPPFPGADSMTVQQLGERHCSLVDVNRRMMDALERINAGEQHSGPHPVSVMREKLVTHVSLIATVMLLHPDDLLNKIRVLNHSTMQLEDCADQAWQRMWDIVDDLGFTEQQQYLISIGCGVFKRLISGVMQQRQALAARQQELLQVNSNGRSVDLQEQQACAERLHVAVRKERFLSQCWGTYVTSICSVTQIARLSIKYFPYSPQIAVMGAVLSRKLEEAQEQQVRERERRRRRTHGLVISPAVLAGTTSSG